MNENAGLSPAAGDHPAPETLRAYSADGLAPPAGEAVREHIAGCPDCADLVLELAGLAAPEDAESELSELDIERAWRRARPRLPAPARQTPAESAPWRSASWVPALAAVLLVALAAPLLLRQAARDGDRVGLEPLNPTRGPEATGPCTTLAAGAQEWLLLLPVRRDPGLSAYVLKVLNEDRVVLTTHDPGRPAAGSLAVDLPTADLPPGRYRLQLVGEGEEPVLIEQYCFEVPGG